MHSAEAGFERKKNRNQNTKTKKKKRNRNEEEKEFRPLRNSCGRNDADAFTSRLMSLVGSRSNLEEGLAPKSLPRGIVVKVDSPAKLARKSGPKVGSILESKRPYSSFCEERGENNA